MLKIQVLIISIFLISVSLFSQTRITTDFKDYSSEIFPLRNIKTLDIRALHAQINLQNWDSDSISIETSIEILCDKPNLSKEMLEEIKIRTVSYANTLQVKTVLASDFHHTIPYKITYNIFYPKKIALRIKNSHGSVNVGRAQGGVSADISYSNIDIQDINQENDSINNHLNLLHCKGKIAHLGSALLHIENSSLNIYTANNIEASSSYSLMSIDTVSTYSGASIVDNIKIGRSKSIELTSDNSIINLAYFENKAKFECIQGSLKVLNSADTFHELIINNHQTPTQIHVNKNTSYTINGEIINGNFSHPQTDKIQLIKDQNNISVSGEVGINPNSDTKVIIFNRDQNIEFN